MRKSTSQSPPKGFTLVELIVVISIVAVLMVALVAVIDPLEQLRRGTDSARKAAAVQLKDALDRLYTVKESFPWDGAFGGPPPGGTSCNDGEAPNDTPVFDPLANGGVFATTCLTAGATEDLVEEGELSPSFIERTTLRERSESPPSALFITQIDRETGLPAANPDKPQIVVCFDPLSRSESLRSDAIYTRTGALNTADCPSDASLAACYWCIK